MAKYSRRDSKSIALTSTNIGWGVAIAVAVLTATFFLGMYYGYSRGYQSAKQSDIQKTADRSMSKKSITETETKKKEKTNTKNSSSSSEKSSDRKSSITESDLGFSDGQEKQDNQSDNTSKTSRSSDAGSAESTTSTGSADDESQSSSEDVVSGDQSLEPPYYTIQISSSQKKSNSKRVRDSLREAGHKAIITKATVDGSLYYRVRVGKFKTRSEAADYAKKMKEEGEISDYWISKIRP